MAPPQLGSRLLTAKMIRAMRDPYDVMQLDATAYPGNSGSPVFDQRSGRVLGVINSVLVKGTKEAAIEKPSGISYAIPVRFVHELLEKAPQ
jgi:S1-C subfamily serine protease